MAIQGKRFGKTGSPMQVAGLKTSDAKVTVVNTGLQFDANNDRIVEIQDYSGSGGWFAIKSKNDITNPTAANANAYIPPFGITRPFILPKGYYIETSVTCNIRALDTEDV